MKKFYKLVSASESSAGGYEVQLDGKPVKTPGGAVLAVPNKALADEIVAEWAEQGDDIIPNTMPLMQMVTTAQEKIPRDRAAMTEKTLAYIDTDLLCYRTDHPEDVGQKQCESWDPWLAWFEKQYGVAMETTTGLGALKQPQEAHEKIAADINALDDMRFTAFQIVAVLTGSVILTLAFIKGDASPEQLFDAAHVEENHKAEIYNEEKYGAAPLQEKKQNAMKRDLAAARKFLDLI